MKEVTIAELKARLSNYLRLVKAGEELIIKDRDQPVAHVTAIQDRARGFYTIPPRLTRKEAEAKLKRIPKADLSKITPQIIDETIQWMKRDRSNDWFKE